MGKSRSSSSSSSSSSSDSSPERGSRGRSKKHQEADILQVKAERSSISPVRESDKKKRSKSRSKSPAKKQKQPEKAPNKKDDILTNKTGGAYIPPARLRAMQESITDKNSTAYQRISWEALKKSIHGIVNKVNVSNISLICRELFSENILRGRGLLSRSILFSLALFAPSFFSNLSSVVFFSLVLSSAFFPCLIQRPCFSLFASSLINAA